MSEAVWTRQYGEKECEARNVNPNRLKTRCSEAFQGQADDPTDCQHRKHDHRDSKHSDAKRDHGVRVGPGIFQEGPEHGGEDRPWNTRQQHKTTLSFRDDRGQGHYDEWQGFKAQHAS